jgi:predicted nucleic acid-binding protein
LLRGLLDILPLTEEVHEHGLLLAARHDFHVYDAMIVAAAELAGCDILWSEDMQHGMQLDSGLQILDPFR